MIKSLYSPFRKWTEKGTLWIYSDPHFSDPQMAELRKNYIGDDEQIARINSKVGKNDTIIFLGDISNEEMIRKIRGYKVLIMGNHDRGASKYADIFDEVYEGPLFIAEKLILSHEPIDLPYAVNVHGHEHRYIFRDHHMNVCAEHIGYYPINLDKEIKKGLLSKVESIHRQTIDRATERKQNSKRDKFLSIKVGDIVWVYDFMWGLLPCEVDSLYNCRCGKNGGCTFEMTFTENDIDKYVFFSFEEAEAYWNRT